MSINLNVDVSGVSALLQRASALTAGNRTQHVANERLGRVKERAGDLDLAGKGARQKMADAFEAAGRKRLAEQRRQQDSWADRKPIGHRNSSGYPVAMGWSVAYNSIILGTPTGNFYGLEGSTYNPANYPPGFIPTLKPNRSSTDIYALNGASATVTFPAFTSPFTSLSNFYTNTNSDTGEYRTGTSSAGTFYGYAGNAGESSSAAWALPVDATTFLVSFWDARTVDWLTYDWAYVGGSYTQTNFQRILEAHTIADSISTLIVSSKSVRLIPTPSTYTQLLTRVFMGANNFYWRGNRDALGFNTDSSDYGQPVTPSTFQHLARHDQGITDMSSNGYTDVSSDLSYFIQHYGASFSGTWLDHSANTYNATHYSNYTNDLTWPIIQRQKVSPYAFGSTRPNTKATAKAPSQVVEQTTYNTDPLILPYFAWDWGNPAYCRQQLYALGFTAADLTP